jgi:hypothetical protein
MSRFLLNQEEKKTYKSTPGSRVNIQCHPSRTTSSRLRGLSGLLDLIFPRIHDIRFCQNLTILYSNLVLTEVTVTKTVHNLWQGPVYRLSSTIIHISFCINSWTCDDVCHGRWGQGVGRKSTFEGLNSTVNVMVSSGYVPGWKLFELDSVCKKFGFRWFEMVINLLVRSTILSHLLFKSQGEPKTGLHTWTLEETLCLVSNTLHTSKWLGQTLHQCPFLVKLWNIF